MLNTDFKKSFSEFADFFLPRFCLCCNKRLNYRERAICSNCEEDLPLITNDFIRLEYDKKFGAEKNVDRLLSLYIFQAGGNLQTLLHELKYNNKFNIGKILGEKFAAAFKKEITENNIELIVPLPLHKLKQAERGFNQSYFIAQGISKLLNIPVCRKCAHRVKYTSSQTKLNLLERKENMKGAFVLKQKNKIKGKNILIIDDVITTGATVGELAEIFKKAGARNITAASVAVTDIIN